MEKEFRAILMGSASVSAIVGDRIHFRRHPQGQPLPAVILNVASETGSHHMQGANSLREARVQVDLWADTYGEAKALHRAVKQEIDGYRGGNFQGVFFSVARDMDEGGTNEAARPFRVSADYETQWSENNG